MKKNEQRLKYLWDSTEHTNVSMMEVPGDWWEEYKWEERLSEEIIDENFPNLMNDMNLYHESKRLNKLQIG